VGNDTQSTKHKKQNKLGTRQSNKLKCHSNVEISVTYQKDSTCTKNRDINARFVHIQDPSKVKLQSISKWDYAIVH